VALSLNDAANSLNTAATHLGRCANLPAMLAPMQSSLPFNGSTLDSS